MIWDRTLLIRDQTFVSFVIFRCVFVTRDGMFASLDRMLLSRDGIVVVWVILAWVLLVWKWVLLISV